MGGISPQWHLLTHQWNLGPGYHAWKVQRRSLKLRLPRQELSGSLMRTKWFNAFWRSVEMRLLWPSRSKKPKNMTHSKKAELPKDEGKMAPFQRHKVQALDVMRVMHLRVQRNYLPEEKY